MFSKNSRMITREFCESSMHKICIIKMDEVIHRINEFESARKLDVS